MRRIALSITAIAISALALSALATAPATAASHHKSAYVKTYGTFKKLTQTGTADGVVALPKKAKSGIIIATYSGDSNFIIGGLDKSNQPTTDNPVNEIGAYSGTTLFGIQSLGNRTKTFKVTATGSWSVTIEPIKKAPKLPVSGKGDGVYRYSGAASTWKLTNSGSSNFIVEQTAHGLTDPLVNEIGNYSGTVPALSGPSVVSIQSDGNWTITKS